ncbi:hypothetical protein TREMEDRAFT_73064 [Tremella mesenterica DSM 1558]|uniref:uncharacterized protein n=1 Tax=Tremella mesenterica (strain ATCC 24925 / CBS 8224 / DSM 1558 / NBRC 9311 / NRRL Y-6157 / RJB 2259-6 / UBC 559-6) TaxID=578456 RepID=UPI0003F498BA|nr:uncharacterized protein TREMEDRAFT_73064 [Tremella mesenterica DSM 1558]EIW73408.1 hypothetical protein TREMEDRAFT_73064 [Tremella mesenterica DSM 1558]
MSKPKPGLGKGIVRTLAHHHPSSSITSSPLILPLAPIVSTYQHQNQPFILPGPPPSFPLPDEPGSSGSSRQPKPSSLQPLPFDITTTNTTGIINSNTSHAGYAGPSRRNTFSPLISSNAYLSLLPSWDLNTLSFSRLTKEISSVGPIVSPYIIHKNRHKTLSKNALRRYTTPTSSNRAAVEISPFTSNIFTPPLPSSLLTLEELNFPSNFSRNQDQFYSSPPPPPSPSSSPTPGQEQAQPPQTVKTRPSSNHTVLSVTPLSDTSDSPSFQLTNHPSFSSYHYDDLHLSQPSTDTNSGTLGLNSNSLIFHLGSAGIPKERTPPSSYGKPPPPLPRRIRSFPLPDISPPTSLRSIGVGEDAFFTRLDGMCIADGVGSWAKSNRGGADASRWSRLLTHFCEGELDSWWASREDYMMKADEKKGLEAVEVDDGPHAWARDGWKEGEASEKEKTGLKAERRRRRPLSPVEIMQKGFEKCLACSLQEGIHGSSTCLLALLYHSTLLIANVGDCALLLIRNGQVVFRTVEMQHSFNFPMQLGTHSRDEPMKDAKRYDVGVDRGDVVILASDGLTDNLFDDEILEVLSEFAPPLQNLPHFINLHTPPSTPPTTSNSLPPFSPQKVSEALAQRARNVSGQTTANTPFMHRAKEEGIDFVGGKRDDISVIVGVIGDRDDVSPGLALHT